MGAAAEKLDTSQGSSQGELLSKAAIAKRVKLHVQTVGARLEELGYEPHESSTPKNQLYFFDSEMEFAIRKATDSFSAVKIRQARADAQLKELRLAKAAGELVPIGEATDFAQRLTKALYEEYANRLPTRVAGPLVKAKTQAAVRKILKDETDRIMKTLRTNFERFLAEYEK